MSCPIDAAAGTRHFVQVDATNDEGAVEAVACAAIRAAQRLGLGETNLFWKASVSVGEDQWSDVLAHLLRSEPVGRLVLRAAHDVLRATHGERDLSAIAETIGPRVPGDGFRVERELSVEQTRPDIVLTRERPHPVTLCWENKARGGSETVKDGQSQTRRQAQWLAEEHARGRKVLGILLSPGGVAPDSPDFVGLDTTAFVRTLMGHMREASGDHAHALSFLELIASTFASETQALAKSDRAFDYVQKNLEGVLAVVDLWAAAEKRFRRLFDEEGQQAVKDWAGAEQRFSQANFAFWVEKAKDHPSWQSKGWAADDAFFLWVSNESSQISGQSGEVLAGFVCLEASCEDDAKTRRASEWAQHVAAKNTVLGDGIEVLDKLDRGWRRLLQRPILVPAEEVRTAGALRKKIRSEAQAFTLSVLDALGSGPPPRGTKQEI